MKYAWLIFFLLIPTVAQGAVRTDVAVVHHTDSHDVSVDEIDRWHRERGWDGIGYHWLIRADGSIEEGRSMEKAGAHARGRNDYVGIALTGRSAFTPAQIAALQVLLRRLGVQRVERHHAECPGPGLDLEALTW